MISDFENSVPTAATTSAPLSYSGIPIRIDDDGIAYLSRLLGRRVAYAMVSPSGGSIGIVFENGTTLEAGG